MAVRLDPFQRIVNVHWNTEGVWYAIVRHSGIGPVSGPLTSSERFEGEWDIYYSLESYGGNVLGGTALTIVQGPTQDPGPIFTAYEAMRTLGSMQGSTGGYVVDSPYAHYLLSSEDLGAPLNTWSLASAGINGFLPYHNFAGSSNFFNDPSPSCPPNYYSAAGSDSDPATSIGGGFRTAERAANSAAYLQAPGREMQFRSLSTYLLALNEVVVGFPTNAVDNTAGSFIACSEPP